MENAIEILPAYQSVALQFEEQDLFYRFARLQGQDRLIESVKSAARNIIKSVFFCSAFETVIL